MSFISSSPHNISLEEFERGNNLATTCYKPNPVFSKAFDDFAKELVIVDPKDKEKCGEVREELGFDRDHQFDTEVREKFHEHMCDPFFTGVDHTGPLLEAPPQFEMLEYTPVEYEAVEYSWNTDQRDAHKISILQATRRVTTIPRPPLESSRRGEFRSEWSFFV